MFDAVRNNKKIIQIILALIILPFAFWGVESYVRNVDGQNEAAKVGGSVISQQEFVQALREQQDRLRPMLGGKNPAMLDSPEMRRAVLDSLVNQRLLAVQAAKNKLAVTDAQLAEFIMNVPSLQENGKFARERYEALVAAQGMSKEAFEARLRQDMVMQQLLTAVGEAVMPGRSSADIWIGAQLEERAISEAVLRPEQYAGGVKLAADAAKAYYEANRKQFETPEQVRAEFVVLNPDKLGDQAMASEDEIKQAYAARADKFKQAETRRASHILIRAEKGAAEEQIRAAQGKAEQLLAQLGKTPGEFDKLARQHSQDPGSAANGGDLGWFGRGMMVPPFEQAVFSLKEGELSGVVRSDFGFHIIKLTGLRAERVRPLEEVRGELAAEIKRQNATKRYAEAAETFSNIVYEQADSLKPVAEKFKLAPQQSGWIARNGAAVPPFTNAKLMAALFADDAIKNKRNTEAVEVAPNTLVAARVLEHKPAALLPFETAQSDIEKLLLRQEAAKLAAKDGADKLARLRKGESLALAWSPQRRVMRAQASQMPSEAVRVIFKADAGKLPAYAGVDIPGAGYLIYRIAAVSKFAAGGDEPPAAQAQRQRHAQLVAQEETAAWFEALKARYEPSINQAVLEAK